MRGSPRYGGFRIALLKRLRMGGNGGVRFSLAYPLCGVIWRRYQPDAIGFSNLDRSPSSATSNLLLARADEVIE